MKLPAELRLNIYELTRNQAIEYMAAATGLQMRPRGMLALLLTSKTIRAESGKALAPLWSTHIEVLEKTVVLLENNKASRQEICSCHSLLQSFAVLTGASVTGVEEAKNTLVQTTRELNDAYVQMCAMLVVQLALHRAADDSRL